jgi:nucleoside diphosphate kinase
LCCVVGQIYFARDERLFRHPVVDLIVVVAVVVVVVAVAAAVDVWQ